MQILSTVLTASVWCTTLFNSFVKTYNRTYIDAADFEYRKHIFCLNAEYIETSNQRNGGEYTLAINAFADLTDAEFSALHTSSSFGMLAPSLEPTPETNGEDDDDDTPIPGSVDWVALGHVTPVKNQGPCGSCWAFGAVAGIESHYSIYRNLTLDLSEQELVDCAWPYVCFGCSGGEAVHAFAYARDHGLENEKDYPYVASDQFCWAHRDQGGRRIFIRSWKMIPALNETKLVEAVARKGPMNVAVAASSRDFKFYKSGILSRCDDQLDHAVVVVGYGPNYLKIKNSWGSGYGESGYIRVARGHGREGICGIVATAPAYPITV